MAWLAASEFRESAACIPWQLVAAEKSVAHMGKWHCSS